MGNLSPRARGLYGETGQMSLEKSDILTAVRARMGRGTEIEDINVELKAVMIDLSQRVAGALQKTGTVTVADGTSSIALPSDCIRVREVLDPNGKNLGRKDIGEILTQLGIDTDAAATLEDWTVFEKKLYVFPRSSGGHAVTLYYRYEDSNVDAITMDDCFSEALIEGVCHKIELGMGVIGGITAQTITHGTFYEKEVAALQERYAGR